MNRGVIGFIVLALLGCGGSPAPPEVDMTEDARKRAMRLDEACQAYYQSNSAFPPDLQTLTRPRPGEDKPLVTPDRLLDPWGKPYRYDPKGEKNGRPPLPDIWTVTPSGRTVGNW